MIQPIVSRKCNASRIDLLRLLGILPIAAREEAILKLMIRFSRFNLVYCAQHWIVTNGRFDEAFTF
ncbi:hypothetical protein BOO93_09985 [Vibrio navarrensis]|nr:hypothetical protein [Vibrio navarrensis]